MRTADTTWMETSAEGARLKLAIIGGAGFLGEHVAKQARAAETDAVVFDRRTPNWVDRTIRFVQGDVADRNALCHVLAGCDFAIHAAFAPPYLPVAEQERVNVDGLAAVLDAAVAANVPRVIVVSSTIVDRDLRPHPLSSRLPASRLATYARTRRVAETLASSRTAPSVGIARPRTLMGPGGIGAFALQFRAIRRGDPVFLPGSGACRYQLLHVEDFASGLLRFGRSDHRGVLAFGARDVRPLAEELSALIDHAKSNSRIAHLPEIVGRIAVAAAPTLGIRPFGEIYDAMTGDRDVLVDITGASERIGWVPAWSNLDALIDAYDWYRDSPAARPNHPMPRTHSIGLAMLTLARRALDAAKRTRR